MVKNSRNTKAHALTVEAVRLAEPHMDVAAPEPIADQSDYEPNPQAPEPQFLMDVDYQKYENLKPALIAKAAAFVDNDVPIITQQRARSRSRPAPIYRQAPPAPISSGSSSGRKRPAAAAEVDSVAPVAVVSSAPPAKQTTSVRSTTEAMAQMQAAADKHKPVDTVDDVYCYDEAKGTYVSNIHADRCIADRRLVADAAPQTLFYTIVSQVRHSSQKMMPEPRMFHDQINQSTIVDDSARLVSYLRTPKLRVSTIILTLGATSLNTIVDVEIAQAFWENVVHRTYTTILWDMKHTEEDGRSDLLRDTVELVVEGTILPISAAVFAKATKLKSIRLEPFKRMRLVTNRAGTSMSYIGFCFDLSTVEELGIKGCVSVGAPLWKYNRLPSPPSAFEDAFVKVCDVDMKKLVRLHLYADVAPDHLVDEPLPLVSRQVSATRTAFKIASARVRQYVAIHLPPSSEPEFLRNVYDLLVELPKERRKDGVEARLCTRSRATIAYCTARLMKVNNNSYSAISSRLAVFAAPTRGDGAGTFTNLKAAGCSSLWEFNELLDGLFSWLVN
jgi:hypothetical protein